MLQLEQSKAFTNGSGWTVENGRRGGHVAGARKSGPAQARLQACAGPKVKCLFGCSLWVLRMLGAILALFAGGSGFVPDAAGSAMGGGCAGKGKREE